MDTRTGDRHSPRPARLLPALVMASILVGACSSAPSSPDSSPLPLHPVAEIALPGDNSRFDYGSLDPDRGLLFIAHLGADEVIEVDLHTRQVVRTIPNLSQAHGVLVVPELRRVYVTATGDNHLVILDEDTAAVIGQAPTGDYPDGIAYDPKRGTVWTTNESGGSETVARRRGHRPVRRKRRGQLRQCARRKPAGCTNHRCISAGRGATRTICT